MIGRSVPILRKSLISLMRSWNNMRMTPLLMMESLSDTHKHCSQPALSSSGEQCQLQQLSVPCCRSAMPLLHAVLALHTNPVFSLQLQTVAVNTKSRYPCHAQVCS